MRFFFKLFLIALIAVSYPVFPDSKTGHLHPTKDNGKWRLIKSETLPKNRHHTNHAQLFGKNVSGYNHLVLKGIDTVQGTKPEGGGYFTGITAKPPESPVGYALKLFGTELLKPPRSTSYCSGATYAVFIEAMNLIFPEGAKRISPKRAEAMRMQEPDGARRKDGVKFWGHWNADGFGSQYSLVQYTGMGKEVTPKQARPGDFMNISWKNGGGHSVIFLGWTKGKKQGEIGICYWSSQEDSNGFADVYLESTDSIKYVKIVRLCNPEKIFDFDVKKPVEMFIPGDRIVFL